MKRAALWGLAAGVSIPVAAVVVLFAYGAVASEIHRRMDAR